MARNGNAAAAPGFFLSAVAITAAMGAGAGVRLDLWEFRQGFAILRWAAYAGIAGTALSLAGAFLGRPGKGRRGFPLALAGIALGGIAFGVPGNWYRIAKEVPMIHDISTDTENPPAFVSVLARRKDAPNPATYGGPEVAAKQRAAYPDIRPIDSGLPPAKAFERALSAARRMRWDVVDESRAEGRIEATATTPWFGFKDDVVIRIAPSAGGGSRVDIRSVSRVGRSDLGTNARRIRDFLKTFHGLPTEAR